MKFLKGIALLLLTLVSVILTGCNSGNTENNSNIDQPVNPSANDGGFSLDFPKAVLSDGKEVSGAALIFLGDKLFNDDNLSSPAGQSCASCHSFKTGFDDPNDANPTSLGADGISFDNRNAPTAGYAAYIPELTVITDSNGKVKRSGGLFLDGRAFNLVEQAKGPFLNPIEMGNASKTEVIEKIRQQPYARAFELVFGEGILDDPETAYDYVADAIAAFERTDIFSPFSSKFDRVKAGLDSFSESEQRGETLFHGQAGCKGCHLTDEESDSPQIFSNFAYRNVGVPSNPLLPSLMADPAYIDLGLGTVTEDPADDGKYRVPTLRNIAKTAPYMHNGAFNTLEEVIDFYNTRDTTFNQLPEVAENVSNFGTIGELGLSEQDIEDLVAFLNTLSDE